MKCIIILSLLLLLLLLYIINISKLNYLINLASTTRYVTHFSGILSSLKFAWKRIYTVLVVQRLINKL